MQFQSFFESDGEVFVNNFPNGFDNKKGGAIFL
jgi:hypothetical protein